MMSTPAKATPAKATPAKATPATVRPGRKGVCYLCELSNPSVRYRAKMEPAEWRPRMEFFDCHIGQETADLTINGKYFSSGREQTCDSCAVDSLEVLEGTAQLERVRSLMKARRARKRLLPPPPRPAASRLPMLHDRQPTIAAADDDLQAMAAAFFDQLPADELAMDSELQAISEESLFETPPPQLPKLAPSDGGERGTSEQSRLLPPRSLFEDASAASSSTAIIALPCTALSSAVTTTATALVASALFSTSSSSPALTIIPYEPGTTPEAHVQPMLAWAGAVSTADVERTTEAALRGATVFAGFAAAKLVGFAAVDLAAAGAAYLLEVYVHEDWRQRGVGFRLVEAVKEAVAKHGRRSRVRLTVAEDNPAAIALYMKSGFVTIEAFPTYRILECCVE